MPHRYNPARSCPSLEEYENNFGLFRRSFHDLLCENLMNVLNSKGGDYQIYDHNELSGQLVEFGLTPDLVDRTNQKVYEVTITTNSNSRTRVIMRKKYIYTHLDFQSGTKGFGVEVFCWSGDDDDPLFGEMKDKELLLKFFESTKTLEELGHSNSEYIDFPPESELKLISPALTVSKELNLPRPEEASTDDSGYIEYIVDKLTTSVKERVEKVGVLPWNSPLDPSPFSKSLYAKYSKSTTSKPPKILQLGLPAYPLMELPFDNSGIVRDRVESGLFSTLPVDRKECGGRLESQYQLEAELQGPGKKRKNPMKLDGIRDRPPPKALKLDGEFMPDLENLISELDGDIYDENSSVSFMLRFYERISTEIITNSMNKKRRRNYWRFSSGFEGVECLLAPGPILRTESNVMWVKIRSDHPSLDSPLSKAWKPKPGGFESDWLSVDTERLNHWSRSYDRVRMAFSTMVESLFVKGETVEEIHERESRIGNASLISLIYLEDKLLVSQTIENSRYVLMKSLGDKEVIDLVGKFPSRINSVLQVHCLLKIIDFVNVVLPIKTTDILKLERRFTDSDQSKVLGVVPRMILRGSSHVPLTCSINEIYLGCLYNPSRSNKTQDSFEILKKIATLESSLSRELESRSSDQERSNHLFGIHSWEEDIAHCVSGKPEDHYYSIHASRIGFKLLVKRNKNFIDIKGLNHILDKTLDQFATFKASIDEIVDMIIDEKEIDRYDSLDLRKKEAGKMSSSLGIRSKCLVYANVLNGMSKLTMRDVLKEELGKENGLIKVLIQIFKKLQWGGVREILILKLSSRICINLCESIARKLAESDSREMLTDGSSKQSSMREDHDSLLRENSEMRKPIIVRRSADMTKWCQKFINWIFSPMFENLPPEASQVAKAAICVTGSHMLKRIEYPKELVKMWLTYPEVEHISEPMQQLKARFLDDLTTKFKPSMMNISNMGQGIYHFSSTNLALACTEFSDLLFEKWLRRNHKIQCVFWKTRKSSDDVGEQIIMDLANSDSVTQFYAFMMCRRWSERLFSMEESIKTSAGFYLYEFNSTFMMNTDSLTPTIKFSLAACAPMTTDSFTESVGHSFSSIRQLFENGASLELCQRAHSYNRNFLQRTFSTEPGMLNDPEKLFNKARHQIPYDLGVYPMFDPSIMVTLGPEWYNHHVFSADQGNDLFKMIYGDLQLESISSIFVEDKELQPDLWDKFESHRKQTPLRIPQGFVSQLQSLKRRIEFNPDFLKSELFQNYLLTLRDPFTINECKLKIQLKVVGLGAKKAMKRTSEAIYLGRHGALSTAKCFNGLTYSEYVLDLRERSKNKDIDLENWFPKHWLYSGVHEWRPTLGKPRTRLFRSPTRLSVSQQQFPAFSNFKSYFYKSIGVSNNNDDYLNFDLFKSFFPFDFSTFNEFDENSKKTNLEPVVVLTDAMAKFESRKTKTMHAVTSCGSSHTFSDTLKNIRSNCFRIDKIYGVEYIESVVDPYQIICDLADVTVCELKGLCLIGEEDWARYNLLKNFLITEEVPLTVMMKKALALVIMRFCPPGERSEMMKYCKIILNWYILKQTLCNGEWVGDLVYVVSRHNTVVFTQTDGTKEIGICGGVRDVNQLVQHGLRDLGWTLEDFIEERNFRSGELIVVDGKIRTTKSTGRGTMLKSRGVRSLPRPLDLNNLKFSVNAKNQIEVETPHSVVLNYSLKILSKNSSQNFSVNIEKERLLDEITDLMQVEEPEEDSDYDFDEDLIPFQEEELQNFKEEIIGDHDEIELDFPDPDELKEEMDDEFYLPDDFVSQLEVRRAEKWTMVTYREFLENCLFTGFEDDHPANIFESEVFAKLYYLHEKQATIDGERVDYISLPGPYKLFNYYCLRLGLEPLKVFQRFEEFEEPSLPCALGAVLSGDERRKKIRSRFRKPLLVEQGLNGPKAKRLMLKGRSTI